MAGEGRREQSGKKSKDTTPLLENDLEIAYGTTKVADPAEKKKSAQSYWEWAKAEAACYSKYMCPVILANLIIVVIILAYFGVLT